MPKQKPRLLIFLQWFTPAHKAGGPIRSVQNLVDLLHNSFEIFIFSGDRDMFDDKPFENINLNTWIDREGKYQIIYLTPHKHTTTFIKQVVSAIRPDAVYLNSMYSYKYFLMPLWALRSIKYSGIVVLAPRGMLKNSALKFKALKKKIFLLALSSSKLLKNVKVQATDAQEYQDVMRWLKMDAESIVLLNNPIMAVQPHEPMTKKKGNVSLLFNGRIHPIKGLDIVLDALRHLHGDIQLDVVGFIEVKSFYYACLEKIKKLPSNVSVHIHGDQPFAICMELLRKAHFLILPTHGENFGHAIFESFCMGKPVIISTETPWKNLQEKEIGWDIELNQPQKFAEAIQHAANMEAEKYLRMSQKTTAFAISYITESRSRERYTQLFMASS